MSTPDDGGPAFPCPSFHDDPQGSWPKGFGGMTLRDYFAAAALQGWISNRPRAGEPRQAADYAYHAADAMLAERARKGNPQ